MRIHTLHTHAHHKQVHITNINYFGKIKLFSYITLKHTTEKLTAASTHYRDMQEEYEKGVSTLAIVKCISHTQDHNISPQCF